MDQSAVQLMSFILSSILGIGGLLVAGLSAFWAYASRVEPYKKQLYERQTQAATECVIALAELEMIVEKHHASIGSPPYFEKGKDRASFVKLTREAKNNLKSILYKWSPILPYTVFMPMTQYVAVIEFASGERGVAAGWAGVSQASSNPWHYLPGYFLETIAAVRDFLGIDPLAKDISKIFGSDEEKDEKKRAQFINKRTAPLGYLMSTDYRKPYTYTVDLGYVSPSDLQMLHTYPDNPENQEGN